MGEQRAAPVPVWQDWRVLVVGLGTLAVPLDSALADRGSGRACGR